MVVFICNGCGDSLKKQQVDKHLQFMCRRGQSVSCVDCSKDFTMHSYKEHTACVSEDQKYGGKNYQAKPNKGQVKQEQWTQRVQEALANVGGDKQLGNVLERLLSYDNIPRKKAKFANFMMNSFRAMVNPSMIEKIWNIVESQAKPPAPKVEDVPKEVVAEKEEPIAKKLKVDNASVGNNVQETEQELPKFRLEEFVIDLLSHKTSGISFDKLLKRIIKAASDNTRFRPNKKMESFDDSKLEKLLLKLHEAGQVSYSDEEKEKRVVLLTS